MYHHGGAYSVADFLPGIYRLPIDAIQEATPQDEKARADEIIEVDACQIFFVDSGFVEKFRAGLDLEQGSWPNYSYFEELRKIVGVDFGHATVISDGAYVLDLSELQRPSGGKKQKPKRTRPQEDLYEKVADRMGTFVCEECFEEELMGGGHNWDLAQSAKEQGWLLVPREGEQDGGFFKAFQVIGPQCAAKRKRDG